MKKIDFFTGPDGEIPLPLVEQLALSAWKGCDMQAAAFWQEHWETPEEWLRSFFHPMKFVGGQREVLQFGMGDTRWMRDGPGRVEVFLKSREFWMNAEQLPPDFRPEQPQPEIIGEASGYARWAPMEPPTLHFTIPISYFERSSILRTWLHEVYGVTFAMA